MKKWATEFRAIDPKDGELKTWVGEPVEAPSWGLAQEWCYNNMGHLKVVGELVCEIPCIPGTYLPDFKNKIDFDTTSLN